jgi:general secretion pathway protein M
LLNICHSLLDAVAHTAVRRCILRLSLQAAPAPALAQWLAQAREQAHTRPIQAQLQHNAPTATAPTTGDKPLLWSGSLLLRLP